MSVFSAFNWVFKLTDGSTLEVPQFCVQRTLDRRGSWETPRVVYEVSDHGLVRKLWPEDIISMEQVAL